MSQKPPLSFDATEPSVQPQALRFMVYADRALAAETMPALGLTVKEEHLLNRIGMAWLDKQSLSVSETTEYGPPVMSVNSAHRGLKRLRQLGLVQLVIDPVDERRKLVKPSPLALEFFSRMGRVIAGLPPK